MTAKSDADICEVVCVHTETVKEVKKRMADADLLLEVAELFKVLGDHTRIRILHALNISELCVCDLAGILDMSQSAISHQLRVLRAAKVVTYRKEGKNVFYSLVDRHVVSLLNDGMDHVQE